MRLDIKNYKDEETGLEYRAIFVDGELFDWGIDPQQLQTAKAFIAQNPEMRKSVMGDIERHFVSCFSEFLERDITLAEINRALETGEIK